MQFGLPFFVFLLMSSTGWGASDGHQKADLDVCAKLIGDSPAAPTSSTEKSSLPFYAPPYPAHIPRFDEEVYEGHVPLNQYRDRNYIWIDKFKDPATGGYINRARVSDLIANYRDATYSGGYAIYKFAKNFKLAQQLGFAVDAENQIIYYPDETSFNERLQKVYTAWQVTDPLFAVEVGGQIPAREYARLVLEENKMARSAMNNYSVHWHDLDSHTLGWMASVDTSMLVLRQRLKFLFAAGQAVAAFARENRRAELQTKEIKNEIDRLIDQHEVYQHIEVGLPDARAIAELLDVGEQAHSRDIANLRNSLLRVGGQSAHDLKLQLLALCHSPKLCSELQKITTSQFKVDQQNVDAFVSRIIERFQ